MSRNDLKRRDVRAQVPKVLFIWRIGEGTAKAFSTLLSSSGKWSVAAFLLHISFFSLFLRAAAAHFIKYLWVWKRCQKTFLSPLLLSIPFHFYHIFAPWLVKPVFTSKDGSVQNAILPSDQDLLLIRGVIQHACDNNTLSIWAK